MHKKHIEVISDYLFDVDLRGKRELVILGNSMSAVPTNTLNLLIKEIIYKTTLFGNNEEIVRYNVFHVAMIFRHAEDGNKYLWYNEYKKRNG